MANPLVADPYSPPANDFAGASDPPLDQRNNNNSSNVICDEAFNNEFMFDDLDFDLDIIFPPDDAAILNNSNSLETGQIDPKGFGQQLIQGFNDSSRVFKSSPELRHVSVAGGTSEACHSSGGQTSSESLVLTVASNQISDVSGYLNVPSPPESNGSNHEDSGNDNKEGSYDSNCPSPESQGSGNCGSHVSEEAFNCPSKSVTSSPIKCGVVVEQNIIKLEEMMNTKDNECSSILKRKKVREEDSNNVSKYQKSNYVAECSNVFNSEGGDEKRKARLMRNRESAQLSRQRKKHYVEELEDKVRTMHSTIQDLNAKISYIMSENATLRSQMGPVPSQMPPPPPGMYPVMYPWMPCAPPYMVKPQGSQVPLVPIPRLKPQAAAPAPKGSKKVEIKKTEMKTKKVASVSFLGLLFFMLLFGGLVPVINMRYGGVREPFTSGDISGSGHNERHRGRVLAVDGQVNGSSYSRTHNGRDYGTNCGRRGQGGDDQPNFNSGTDDFVRSGNDSEPLMASLYVPRNDKLVKIDGNLIIHSVLASEKAMASHRSEDKKNSGETGLAVPGDLAPAIPGRHSHHYRSPADGKRALGSGDKEKAKSTVQQWFLEGVAEPMLSSGMCTEVFQFDVSSSPGGIVPVTTVRNVSMEQRQNATTRTNKGRNRRILNSLSVPVSGVTHNISEEHVGGSGKKDDFTGNNSLSSMVVSVLVDPREAGDADGDGMMGPKSISRIFVVVLIDSVKYVTYSCMLPFKGSVPLVTT
ncbi:PREDICTED: bZIP transcription factor 17-like [Nicotiana attenuata]|uniref:Bzip transcription factor 17 n=1 Tax=Nicotiana attenuata TaxID=49451 RepID=A0A1J6JT85_NICAT|nr:PREDICTED: bZIP transcription factor 17-like [Nicotiana attenuata]OIT20938.1 bzip transcription factor 17 [Nicotiana attenuata]